MESDAFSESSFSNGESCESDENGEIFETCSFNDSVLQLPEFFCDEEDVFREVITSTTWKSLINRKNAERLKQLLPTFPENDELEKQETLRKLFNGDNFRFGSPFKLFFQKLRDGFLSSEVVEITNALKEANYKEYRSQQKQYSYKLLHDVLLSRQKLVEASYALPPENSVKMQQYFTKPKDATLSEKTRLRYFSMLQDLREEIGEVDTSSDDENYPESCPLKVPKKYKKHFNHEVSTGASICMPTTSDTSNYSGNGNFFHTNGDAMEVSEDRYREMLQNHKEKALLEPKRPELSTTFIDIKSVSSRCNFPKRASVKSTDGAGKKKAKTSDTSDKSGIIGIPESIESSVPLMNIVIKEEHNTNSSSSDPNIDSNPPAVQETEVQTDPLTLLDEGDDSEICENPTAKLYSPRPEVTQYPTCFFALLRDIFCESSEQKLSAVKLEEKVKNWQGGPTASLFEWMSFQESWSDLVSSALKFLAGDLISILPETFIPFLDYKEKQQQWQWIGSGRDSDEQMFGLCQQWLDGKDDISLDMLETSQGSPPPPRVTTGWTVRPTAENEKQAYRQQECVRYQNPHKAFTFKVHGYEAVVGPVKGVYGKESGVNKAREHSLLTSDRPPFVTILSLVRDSAARLPNGEGTRADICELLKDSQYLAAASDQQIHTVVSGALDRLHYEKDPCVKYDVNRKLWIYLHRHRTEEEFERIHQAQAAAAKARKAVQKNKLPKIKHSRPLPVTLGPETAALNIDIPTLISSGSQSPKTQGSPKPNRFVMHTSSQVDIKMAVESNVKREEDSSISNPPETELIAAPVTMSACVQDISNSRPSTSTYSFATAKNAIGNITATQIVSVTPIQIKSTDQIKPNISTQVHDVLNVDMKPSSPSFVGQPPVLQPVISHQISDKTNPVIPTSTTPTLITTPIITKAKANCLQANALAGFQTIVIKQEPGLRPCGTIPLLSIEEKMPSTNSSGPVVARLVHGSQYLSFSNILASSNACSSNKPLAGTVQNFRVHGGNICQQVLSTSTIKVMHSAPVSAIADTRFPVIQLKNQVNTKEAAPASLNVCGRIYQMTNIRNAVISKPNDIKIPVTKDNSEIEDLKESISATVPSAPLSVPNRKTQPVIKVSPK